MVTRNRHGIHKPVDRMCLNITKHPLQPTDVEEPTCFSQAKIHL